MNDRYLFRGKRKDNHQWVEGDLITKPVHHECVILENGVINHAVDKDTVGQYTTLTDKNGVRIWEGDRYITGNPNIVYTVRFKHGAFVGGNENGFMPLGFDEAGNPEKNMDWIEVIDSIHDTPVEDNKTESNEHSE